jgi:hypothetical protein
MIDRRSFLATSIAGGFGQFARSRFTEPATRAHPGTADIGTRRELLVDDVVIDEVSGLSRVVTRPEKYVDNPVLRADRPWEPQLGEKDSWYFCSGPPGRRFWCYAASHDGLHWDRVDLRLFEYETCSPALRAPQRRTLLVPVRLVTRCR